MEQDYIRPVLRFEDLPRITGGVIQGSPLTNEVVSLVLDSRKVLDFKSGLFFAISGERNDGHNYIKTLYHDGIRMFVVERLPEDIGQFSLAGFLLVNNTVKALQDIAAWHRRQFQIPVIGITGSNGKTIIKEWLYQILSSSQFVVKNPGSYNSQIGVPLSVWQMAPFHTIGIFEAGISKPDEMVNLERVISPTIGIFTNIGPAHDEGFSSRSEKILEKLKLFSNAECVIYCRDHESINEAVSATNIKAFTWGRSDADVVIRPLAGNACEVTFDNSSEVIGIPFSDPASLENCFHVIALLKYLGYANSLVREHIGSLRRIRMRLELKEGINRSYLIDDTYNNDLAGLEISLQFLASQVQKKKKTVILSDVLESGMKPDEMVDRLLSLVRQSSVDRLIGIGPALSGYAPKRSGWQTFPTTEAFLDGFDETEFGNEVVLVKGARMFGFERITRRLQRKIHGTVMEIDLGALVHNLNYVKARIESATKVMVMVKAFAYGSGSNEIASLLQYHKVDYLGVAYPDEGVELRKNNIALPVMVMNSSEANFDQLLEHRLEPEVYSFRFLDALINFLEGRTLRIHLKIDTGMRRLGFEERELDLLVDRLRRNPNLVVASIFSHLAGADEAAHDEFTENQVRAFKTCSSRIIEALGYRPLLHVLNSPGILRFPEHQLDMVRLGIGLYGVDPTGAQNPRLTPVATLKTIISQIKRIQKGESVGYGRRGVATDDTRIATIAIGYADGFSRAFSRGKGKVLINGTLAPVVGNVCMDMTMVDLAGIDAKEGDEVVIFGKELPIQKVAEWIGTIPYEILTNTSERVKRVFIAESL